MPHWRAVPLWKSCIYYRKPPPFFCMADISHTCKWKGWKNKWINASKVPRSKAKYQSPPLLPSSQKQGKEQITQWNDLSVWDVIQSARAQLGSLENVTRGTEILSGRLCSSRDKTTDEFWSDVRYTQIPVLESFLPRNKEASTTSRVPHGLSALWYGIRSKY